MPNKSGTRSFPLLEVLAVSTKLGLTSFGGPIAHLGYFHDEYIRKRNWMDERSYADLVALCQFLPGPASSKVGIGIGIIRAGLLGGLFAWIGFTLPSLILLILFAYMLQTTPLSDAGWVHGLKIVAVAIVAQAILGLGKKLTPDRNRITIAVVVMAVTLLWQTAFTQILLIVSAGLIGLMVYRNDSINSPQQLSVPIRRSFAVVCLVLFFALLIGLPLLRQHVHLEWLAMFDSFYRAGSLVFGGGHVILPLLEREMVPTGWVSKENFLAGYGAAQAVPGPLFTFAGYLGALIKGISGAAIATAAVFLPAFLLTIGALPYWNTLRSNKNIQGALIGINAAVVGLLLAALYNPIWTTAIMTPADFTLAASLFILLVYWQLPPWVVVILGALGGILIGG